MPAPLIGAMIELFLEVFGVVLVKNPRIGCPLALVLAAIFADAGHNLGAKLARAIRAGTVVASDFGYKV